MGCNSLVCPYYRNHCATTSLQHKFPLVIRGGHRNCSTLPYLQDCILESCPRKVASQRKSILTVIKNMGMYCNICLLSNCNTSVQFILLWDCIPIFPDQQYHCCSTGNNHIVYFSSHHTAAAHSCSWRTFCADPQPASGDAQRFCRIHCKIKPCHIQ